MLVLVLVVFTLMPAQTEYKEKRYLPAQALYCNRTAASTDTTGRRRHCRGQWRWRVPDAVITITSPVWLHVFVIVAVVEASRQTAKIIIDHRRSHRPTIIRKPRMKQRWKAPWSWSACCGSNECSCT